MSSYRQSWMRRRSESDTAAVAAGSERDSGYIWAVYRCSCVAAETKSSGMM